MYCFPFTHNYQIVAFDFSCSSISPESRKREHLVKFMICKKCGKRKFTVSNRPADAHIVIELMKTNWLNLSRVLISNKKGTLYNHDDWFEIGAADKEYSYHEYRPQKGENIE